jgi:hypothetical protein
MAAWRPAMDALALAIVAVVGGDLKCLAAVTAAGHRALWDAVEKAPRLLVSRVAVVKVLEEWHGGFLSPEDVQRWASFVRRGYVSGKSSEALHPIPIEYDPNDEELIAEVIGRLDQIGDQVDGHIEQREVEEMLGTLRQ